MDSRDDDASFDELTGLLRGVRAGDFSAEAKLLVLCRRYMHLQAQLQLQAKLKPRVDASDIAQQSLLDAWNGLEGFRGTTSAELLGWLKQIVVRNAIDVARHHQHAAKRGIQCETPMATGSDGGALDRGREFVSPVETPSHFAMKQEEELLLAEAISELSTDYQRVLIFRSFLQMPFAEIAEKMGRTGPAVQMLWARAVGELRRRLDDKETGRVATP
jgi:RNA polymerase sigma-70 factor, ECF subfamily